MNLLEVDVNAQSSASLSLRLGGSLPELKRIVEALEALSKQLAFSQRELLTARLCAEEVFTNIVRHGRAEGRALEICLKLEADVGAIRMDFRDNGTPFNPLESSPQPVNAPTLETAAIGGRGISLLRLYARDIRYAYEGERNCLWVAIQRA